MGIRISEMEEATTFGADDYVPIVTNGTNKKALGSKLKAFFKGGFTAARAVVTDAEGNLSESNVTSAELSNLSGIDRNINGYLTNKAFPTGGVVDNMHASTTSAQDYNGIYWVQKTQWSDMPAGSYGFLEVEGGMQRFTPYGTQGRSDVYIRMFINNAWTPWKQISPAPTSTTTGTNGALVCKCGNVVTIHLDEVLGSNLGTIPDNYRPTTSICAFLYIEKLSSGSISNRYYGMIRANADGSFGGGYIMNYSANSFTSFKDANHKLYGTITYIV